MGQRSQVFWEMALNIDFKVEPLFALIAKFSSALETLEKITDQSNGEPRSNAQSYNGLTQCIRIKVVFGYDKLLSEVPTQHSIDSSTFTRTAQERSLLEMGHQRARSF